ncbi:MAG: hypothetical protein LH481_17745 [Burkholderiales bacterium]|nr:hypothetical protein [Burkholderiales bacterium]
MKAIILSAAVLTAWSVAALAGVSTSTSGGADASRVVAIGEMSVARAAHQSTRLKSGDILITGGCTGGCESNLQSAERYDVGTRTFRPAGILATARDSHAAIALDDGRVLVAGGWSARRATNSAEIYDPASNRFSNMGAMLIARATPAVARLPDGRVLFAGGQTSAFEPLASAEIFDPRMSSFSTVAAMTVPRMAHVAVTLLDGRVLVVGGRQSRRGETMRSAEIFDPVTGGFQATGSMSTARHKHAAALLPDGRVLVIGGSDVRDERGRYQSTEIYDPKPGNFTNGPNMQWPRFKIADAVVALSSGAILVAGGASRLELYDPKANVFTTIPGELKDVMAFTTASLLPNGDVLLLGGYDNQIRTSATAWLVRAAR